MSMRKSKSVLNGRQSERAWLALFLFASILAGCASDDGTRQDSLIAILANPIRYEGRVITVRGFVNLSHNEDAIYLSADDYRWGIQSNGLWLHMPKCVNRTGTGVSRGYMTVVGNFTAKLHGFGGTWIGEIDNISLCRLIEAADGAPRPRPSDP
jgi:hypothetical protein